MDNKQCKKCHQVKPLSEFHIDALHTDGHKNICKSCLSKKRYEKKYFKKGLDKNIRQSLNYAIKHNGPFVWGEFLGYTIQDVRKHLEENFTSEMTWENYGSVWVVSFYIPRKCYTVVSIKDPNLKKFWSLKNLKPTLKKDYHKQYSVIDERVLKEHSLYDILPDGLFYIR